MVSLKKYSKKQILTEGNSRFKKIASMLDKEDLEDQLQQTLSWMNDVIFCPRAILIKPEMVIDYNGGYFVDVTPYKIDVINNAYYTDTFDDQLNSLLPEIGLMPYILGGQTFTSLSSVADYLALRSNLSMMSRQLELSGDYELWPVDEKGRQLLQVKNNKLMRIEYLPNVDRNAEEWYLYDNEYAAIKEVLFDRCNLFNAELQMSASSLGVGKEAKTLVDYWASKLEKDQKKFEDSTLITYIA